MAAWSQEYPIVSIEDALGEDDGEGWGLVTGRLATIDIQLFGDDLFATSPERLRGRLGGGRECRAREAEPGRDADGCAPRGRDRPGAGYATVLSARSGETEGAWLADLAVGWRTGQLKVGSTMRSERTAKWNRLLRIEAERPDAVFAGRAALAPRARH